jgi:hypothetical protein
MAHQNYKLKCYQASFLEKHIALAMSEAFFGNDVNRCLEITMATSGHHTQKCVIFQFSAWSSTQNHAEVDYQQNIR